MTDQPEKQVPQAAAAGDQKAPPQESYDRPARKTEGSGHGVVIAVLVAIIVAGIVVMGVVPRLRAKAALRTETRDLAIPAVVVIHPKRGDPQQEIVLPGNMQAFEDAPIFARTNGYLKKWYVDIGGHVKAGQLLADIETPEVDQQLLVARADLNTAQANLNLSKITADRFDGLKNTDSVSKQDVDNAHGDFEAKKATVAASQSNVRRLEETQAFNKIYAPFDGIITARNTDIGQLIDSGSGGAAREMFHIQSTQVLRVYINVPQQYSQAAKPGLSADLTLAEFPGRRFKGQLVRTANAIQQSSRTLLVEVDVNNASGELLPGGYTEVHLKLPETVPTFILPVNTLIFRAQGLQIATVQDGKATLVPIVLGRDFGSDVEVVSGLSGQENVMVNPPDSLVDGEQVQITQTQQSAGQPQAAQPQSNPQQSGAPKK
ncbi:MAG TPA: efflux RND transporter periplasmic adaptor subunit [Candidatus Acidoferrales bacterium]|jgi:RND family efflux transporter MFP subunit|nr:efflux RND transporter periplasmic adaptor subunit [Candidatus Acidoferrales bacterium]